MTSIGSKRRWDGQARQDQSQKWEQWRHSHPNQTQEENPPSSSSQKTSPAKALKADDKVASGSSEGSVNRHTEDLGHGVILLEDDSPYIVYGGEAWLMEHTSEFLLIPSSLLQRSHQKA